MKAFLQLNNLSVDQFLQTYWQQKSLFLPQAFCDQHDPMPDISELAGLALEEVAESRLVETDDDAWSLRHGPFSQETLETLGDNPYSLLVQGVEQFFPSADRLLKSIEWLPHWRKDDVMASLSNKNGGVGPHRDDYDVFLIQLAGRKSWGVSAGIVADDYFPQLPLKVLRSFTADTKHIASPGDVLYVPPGFAHHGVALDDGCITLSIGFRAPNASDLFEVLAHSSGGDSLTSRYSDRNRAVSDEAFAINQLEIDSLLDLMSQVLKDKKTVSAQILAYLCQSSATAETDQCQPEELETIFSIESHYEKSLGSKWLYHKREDEVLLGVEGRVFSFDIAYADAVKKLCCFQSFSGVQLQELQATSAFSSFWHYLVKAGLVFEDDMK